ncbi:hypothetical protein H8R91_06390 [Ruminococcus sp. NSJ-71]|jgi:hypothetical protein|uniref:DUF3168 domain-containing protein n=1 Tax=Ruminococcus intestinalis TaxID=2763066 RepID=A0ABR7HKT5_9FIRM|nr:hypothetical protein [Ruminococcus intestinalis]MBC5728149.1 hypothetical protein [Ruminococcus intestinalis]
MKVNTEAFITALTERVNTILPTTYEEAPIKNAPPLFAVVSGINIIDLESGDLASFYIDVWADEKAADATIKLERACDSLRNGLYNAIIAAPGLYGHIGFDNQNTVADSEFDIAHRRLALSARLFYY